jgi:hypothetical protein
MTRTHQNAAHFRFRWSFVVTFAILAATGYMRWQSTLMPSDSFVPQTPQPASNARLYFQRATELFKGDVTYEEGMQWPSEMFGNSVTVVTKVQSLPNFSTWSTRQAWLDRNQAAFAEIRQGLKYAYVEAPQRSPWSESVTDYYNLQLLDSAIATATETAEHSGDWGKAMDLEIERIHLGVDLTDGAGTNSISYDADMEDSAERNIKTIVGHLTQSQAESAARQLASIDALRAQPYQSLTEQKWVGQRWLQDAFNHPHWQTRVLDGRFENSSDTEPGSVAASATLESPRTAYMNFSNNMNLYIALAHATWPRLHPLPPPMPDPINHYVLGSDEITGFYCLFYGNKYCALDRLLEVQLALRVYREQNGHYPPNLNALVPKFIVAVPIDPFSDNQPLKYVTKNGRAVLYSIGPDARDDGSKPYYDPKSIGNQYLVENNNQTGDIVAGVNY